MQEDDEDAWGSLPGLAESFESALLLTHLGLTSGFPHAQLDKCAKKRFGRPVRFLTPISCATAVADSLAIDPLGLATYRATLSTN